MRWQSQFDCRGAIAFPLKSRIAIFSADSMEGMKDAKEQDRDG